MVLLLLTAGTLAAIVVPAAAPRFSVDGRFDEWQREGSFPGAAQIPAGLAGPTSVQVAQDGANLFVHAAFSGPLFGGPHRSQIRIFVDADGRSDTGFDMGEVGADLMIEASGGAGSAPAQDLFTFDRSRNEEDWNGWSQVGRPALAMSSDELEAQFATPPGAAPARVLVATSSEGRDAIAAVPAVPGGLVVATARSLADRPYGAGGTDAGLVEVRLEAFGSPQPVAQLQLAATGSAGVEVMERASLLPLAGGASTAGTLGPRGVTFTFGAPLEIGPGRPWTAAVSARFSPDFAGRGGSSFGLRPAAASGPSAFLARPANGPAPGYLGFVSPVPVVDGAFGEWAIAGARADPVAPDMAAGRDIVGTAAMWSGQSGAFFVEGRGPLLQGTPLADLPPVARPLAGPGPVSPVSDSPPTSYTAPAPLPPLNADDRLLVFVDADRDPATGFRPSWDAPMGAEFVLQVAGRFSDARYAHLLAFAGTSPLDSTWVPRGNVAVALDGSELEGELPLEAVVPSMGARLLFQTVDGSGARADTASALQEVDTAGIDSDGLLHFKLVTFDPLRGAPPARVGLLQSEPNGFWVVQFEAGAPQSAARAVEALGATLYGYVHSNGVLAKMDTGTAQAARALPNVRWVGIYQPAFKFATDPAGWPDGPVSLMLLLFDPEPALGDLVAGAGGTLLSLTDRAARVSIQGPSAERLASIADVQFIDLENGRAPLNDVGRNLMGVNKTYDALGLNGSGIVVGISDTGLDFTHPAFDDTGTSSPAFDGRIVGYYRYGSAYGDLEGHGTHTAGSIAGDGDLSNTSSATGIVPYQFRGMAPAASLVETAILASSASSPSDDQVFADQGAYGATVSSNSWGYITGQQQLPLTDYEVHAYLTDLSVIDSNTSRPGLQPMTIVFAAGNDGAGADTVGSPGTSKNVITVGASESNRGYDAYADNASSIASFSSRGPTDDGRVKPDIVAVGTYVLSSQSRTPSCTCTYGGWDQTWTGANYAFSSGTSQATPQVAGMVALVQQHINQTYGRIPSPALVKAALINGAEDLGYGFEYTTGVTGPMSQGWGRANVSRSIQGPPGGAIIFQEEGPTVSTGDMLVSRFQVASAGVPAKFTLVWTDAPGNPQDATALSELINDLDLTVRAPDGTFYHGNKFQGAWSRANNSSFDRVNNVENVFVQSPAVGTWTVEVSGYFVRSADQRFALVVSGNLTRKQPGAVGRDSHFPGAAAGSKFGWNVTAASVNGDAYTDVVVGAPGAGSGNGAVYIFLGGPTKSAADLDVSRADVVLNGTGAEGFGWSLDASGDWNGDGVPDLLVGAPGSGKAYLFLGAANWTARTANATFTGAASDRFGEAVRLVSGLDDRSGAEAVAGAPLYSFSKGRAYVFSGASGSGTIAAASANSTFTGAADGALLGSALSGGDLNGDGHGDLALGEPGDSSAHVVLGGVAAGSLAFGANFTGLPGSRFGAALTLAGDFGADGFDDLLVGAPGANHSAGAAYMFAGRSAPADDRVIRYYFFDDLEAGTAAWDEMSGSSVATTPWSLSSTTYYGEAAAGHSWQDSSGNYNASVDYSIRLHAPLNLSTATSPVLSFVYKADLAGYSQNGDGMDVEYSTNNGSSWTQVDGSNVQGQYDAQVANSNPPSSESALAGLYAFTYDRPLWREVTFNISSLAGTASVVFRFRFAPNAATAGDGVYIDNVAVRERSPSSPNYTMYGAAAGDQFGAAVAAAPSATGVSGGSDMVVGAPYADDGLTPDAGAAYVFQGSPSLSGTTSATASAADLAGDTDGAGAGWAVAGFSGYNTSSGVQVLAGSPLKSSNTGGALTGNATAAVPEFSDVATVAAAAGALIIALGQRRRRAT